MTKREFICNLNLLIKKLFQSIYFAEFVKRFLDYPHVQHASIIYRFFIKFKKKLKNIKNLILVILFVKSVFRNDFAIIILAHYAEIQLKTGN